MGDGKAWYYYCEEVYATEDYIRVNRYGPYTKEMANELMTTPPVSIYCIDRYVDECIKEISK